MSFKSDIEKFANSVDQKLDHVVNASLLDVSTDIIERTPVRHGTAKGGWIPTLDAPGTGEGSPDPDGARTISGAARVSGQAFGRVYYLMNNVPYIRKLEYGRSKQAPQGMVRISVQNFRAALRAAVQEAKRG